MKKILIVGGGGIGERHLRCFLKTGKVEISLCETDAKKIGRLKRKYPVKSAFIDFDKVPLKSFDGVLIATPASLHIPMAIRCAREGVPFLLEKPLSLDLKGVDNLKRIVRQRKVLCGVAYVRRSIPSIRKLKELASKGLIGEIKMGRLNSSQEYPKYRPDYQRIYYAFEKMGGGCILDGACHLVNLSEWLFGKAEQVVSLYDRLQLKRVECEDCCVMILRFKKNRALVEIFLNQFQKPNLFETEIVGTKGNLRYEVQGESHRILICKSDRNDWKKIASYRYSRDDFYVHQASEFLKALDGRAKLPTSIEEAEGTLRICLAAKESQKKSRILRI